MNQIERSNNNPAISNHRPNQLRHTISIAEISAGPLPSPKVLKEYDQLLPGTAGKIVAMAERQANHRQLIEARVVHARTINSRLGLIFGLVIGLAALTAATLAAFNGSALVGSIIGVSGLASLVGVFVYGSQQQRHERQARLQTLTHKTPQE